MVAYSFGACVLFQLGNTKGEGGKEPVAKAARVVGKSESFCECEIRRKRQLNRRGKSLALLLLK